MEVDEAWREHESVPHDHICVGRRLDAGTHGDHETAGVNSHVGDNRVGTGPVEDRGTAHNERPHEITIVRETLSTADRKRGEQT